MKFLKLPKLPKLWGKYFPKTQYITRAKILWVTGLSLVLILLFAGTAAGFIFYRKQQVAPTFLLSADPTGKEIGVDHFLIYKMEEVKVLVEIMDRSKYNFSAPKTVQLKAWLDDQELLTKDFSIEDDVTQLPMVLVPLDGGQIGDGKHQFKIKLFDPDAQLLAERELTIVVDHTAARLEAVTTNKGYLTRYETESDKQASPAAQTGIKLISNTKGPINLSLTFSEPVTTHGVNTNELELVFHEANYTATIAGTLTAKTNTFTTPLVINDEAGNKTTGELQFVYDGQAPTFNVYKDVRIDRNAAPNYVLMFTTSEPMTFVRASTNGVTKTATGNAKNGYRVEGLPLSQDNNVITLTGQDLAGNQATVDIKATVVTLKTYSFADFGKKSLPESVRHCTEEDEKACGFSHDTVGYKTCEEFKVIKDCLQARCSRSGYALGSCTY